MLRFRPKTRTAPHQHRWPESSLSDPSTVFSVGAPLRKLVVVIDHDLLAHVDEATFDEVSLLGGLLSQPYVELYRFRDEGPPEDTPRMVREVLGEFVPGWVVLHEPVAELGHLPVVWADREGKTVNRGALVGNAADVAESDTETPAYRELDPVDAASRRRADAVAVQAASEAHADIFITRRPYLHALTWGLARGILIAEPKRALPLVSLYLRTQGVFIVYRSLDGTATETMNRGLFYFVGTRGLLPAGWRWFTACVQHGAADDSIIYLGQSLFQRVQRALQARDAAHGALNQPQNNDTADEALGNLDLVLLGLMAAVDVAARIAHRALGLEGSERGAAWQRSWLKRVEAVAPELAAVVADGTPGGHTLTILNALRNSIHGVALDALAVGSMTGQREDTLVGLPYGEADDVVAAMDGLGGREAFGVHELLPGRIHADPGVLLDALFAMTLELLNELMRLTPVEHLDGVSLSPEHEHPPTDSPFDERSGRSIRWQLGLGMTAERLA
jgi:hypothetical protein